jgi:hypothetical protein
MNPNSIGNISKIIVNQHLKFVTHVHKDISSISSKFQGLKFPIKKNITKMPRGPETNFAIQSLLIHFFTHTLSLNAFFFYTFS